MVTKWEWSKWVGGAIGEHYKMQHNNFFFKADLADSFSISTYNGSISGKVLPITPDLGRYVKNFHLLNVRLLDF